MKRIETREEIEEVIESLQAEITRDLQAVPACIAERIAAESDEKRVRAIIDEAVAPIKAKIRRFIRRMEGDEGYTEH